MSDSPKSNTIWWIAGGVVVAYLLYNHGTTGTVSTLTTGRGSNIGLPQTKRSVGGFTTRPTVGAAQTNLRNTTATGAISTTTTSQTSILNGILAGISKLTNKGGGMSLGGGGGGGGGNSPSSKNGNATGDGASAGVSTASTMLSTPSVYNGSASYAQSATSSTASGAAALSAASAASAASSTGSYNDLVDPAQSALS